MSVALRSWCPAAALVALSLAPALSGAQSANFRSFRPLTLEELYAKRMRFAQGEPIISVGVMEAQTEVVLRAGGPARLMFSQGGAPKTIYGRPNDRFVFRVKPVRAAQIRYWVVVSDHAYRDMASVEAKRKDWAAQGHDARSFVTGTIVALRGNVLDTRRRQLGIGGFDDRASAVELAARLFKERSLRTTIREELVTLPKATIFIHDGRGRRLHAADDVVYFGTIDGRKTTIENVEHSRGYKRHGRQTRRYWDHVYVAVDRQAKLTVINSVGAERLLGGLVPSEIFARAPLEALKAQAVTARGAVFSKLGHRHFGEPYHLCTEQHCQVYAGAGRERPSTNRAVAETRGLLAVRPRVRKKSSLDLVNSVYSSTCGGFSEDNEIVWDTPPSASLRARLDGNPRDPALLPFRGGLNESNIRAWLEAYPPTYGARSSFTKAKKFRWQRTFAAAEVDQLLRGRDIGRLKDIEILGRGRGGRVTGIRLVGTKRSVDVLRELPVRRLFKNLNSGMFVVDLERNANGTIKTVRFTGGGWGHGVGMCQMGAIGRAEANQTFRQILAHYYNGAVVERLY